jgi:hypothetical protein
VSGADEAGEGQIQVEKYSEKYKNVWNAFVAGSRNGTFLFDRDYMEYHADRFTDASLLFTSAGKLVALLPANAVGGSLVSHGGLTYGGFITDTSMKLPKFPALVDATVRWMKENDFRTLAYKAVPRIYHQVPSDEDLHVLFELGATITAVNAVSVVDMRTKVEYQERRRRGIRKAERAGCKVSESSDLDAYWEILLERLAKGHRARPVHTVEEIKLLAARFPRNIRLFASFIEDRMVAGVLIYESQCVAKAQYIAGNDEGLQIGAVDLTLNHIIAKEFQGKRFVDLGGSNDDSGKLNRMLVDQKEGFGARTEVAFQIRLDV